MNVVIRKNIKISFFMKIFYKPNDAFCALKMEVMSAADNSVV